jgi:hypothetical protein
MICWRWLWTNQLSLLNINILSSPLQDVTNLISQQTLVNDHQPLIFEQEQQHRCYNHASSSYAPMSPQQQQHYQQQQQLNENSSDAWYKAMNNTFTDQCVLK